MPYLEISDGRGNLARPWAKLGTTTGMKRDGNLPELLHRFLYEGTPIPRWTDDEIDAAKRELDRQLTETAERLHSFDRRLTEIVGAFDELDAEIPPALRARFLGQARQLHAVGVASGILRKQRDFLDDLMIVASPNIHSREQRLEAAKRMAAQMRRAGPFAPKARVALKQAAAKRGEKWSVVLEGEIVSGIFLTVFKGEEPQRRREDREWIKDRDGAVALVRPARQYGPGSSDFRRWFEQDVRAAVEQQLAEYCGEQPPERARASYEPIEDHAEKSDDREDMPAIIDARLLLFRDLTPKDRALLKRADSGRLSAADRQRLSRLRKKISHTLSQT
jgi:hypothetical protein